MDYQIEFACKNDEEIVREILLASDMDIAGDIQEHVVIKKDNQIWGGGMLAQTSNDVFHLLVFAVRQNERNKGIGSYLLQELLTQPFKYCLEADNIAERCYKVTTVAKGESANFYKKNGFAACDFSELAYPFNGQCDECPDQVDCQPVAMVFTGVAKNTFKILGSGAGPGAPSFFCDCPGCQEAQENKALARTRSGAFITTKNSNILVDAPPDLRVQLIREKIRHLDEIFLTHWHYDHFGGIGELEYYVKLRRKKPLNLHLPPSAVEQFEKAFPSLSEVFNVIAWEFDKSYHFDTLSITPLPAKHSVETAGFLVKTVDKKLAYFPDTAGLAGETMQNVEGVDWLICDATFHGDNWFPESHMSMEQALELGRTIRAKHTVLTHISVHYSQPVTAKKLQETISPYPGALVAYDGMIFNL